MVFGKLHLLPVKFKCTCLLCWQPGDHTNALLSGTKLLGYLCPECLGEGVADHEVLAKRLRKSARQLDAAAEVASSGRLDSHLAITRHPASEMLAPTC